jgi:putative intracellular protease/amidase
MKKVLTILSEYGYWGEELIGPLEVFDEEGYQIDFATPTGKRPVALPPSMDPTFVDPPLGKPVVSQEMADKVAMIDDPSNLRLNNPITLTDWLPDRPYWSSPKFLREMEAYYKALDEIQDDLKQYDVLLIVGGSGPIVDLANSC